MTTLADDLRGRLDHARIREQAELVVHGALTRGQPVFLSYQPGNSTVYQLIFNPFADGSHWMYVSWVEHGAYRFDFQDVPVASYIIEKLDRRAGLSDAIALHELFTRIQEAT